MAAFFRSVCRFGLRRYGSGFPKRHGLWGHRGAASGESDMLTEPLCGNLN